MKNASNNNNPERLGGPTPAAALSVAPKTATGLLLFDAFFIRGGGRQKESAGFEVDRHDG